MIYYHQIVQNYFKDKTATHQITEQQGAADPKATEVANSELAAAKNSTYQKPYLAKTLAGKPPSGYLAVWNAGNGVMKFNPTVDLSTGMAKNNAATRKVSENFNDFVSYFVATSETGEGEAEPQEGETTAAPAQPTFIMAGGKKYALQEKYSIFEGNLLEPEEFEQISNESGIPLDNINKFLNGQGGNGSVAKLILYSRDSVETSEEDEDILLPFKESENLTSIKEEAAEKLYEVFQILKTKNKQLDIESAKIIKNSIAISNNGEILIKTESTGEGLIIREGSSQALSQVLEHMSGKLIDPETGKQLNIKLNTVSFINKFKMSQGDASFTRGFYYEDVRRGVIHQIRYNRAEAKKDFAQMRISRKEASEEFERWLGKTKKVSNAFESMVKFFMDNGAIGYNVKDSQAGMLMDFIVDHVGSGLSNTPLEALKSLSGLLIRFGAAGVVTRGPEDIFKSGTKVGSGLKADATEVYLGVKEATEALAKVGITDPEIVNRMIKVISKDGNRLTTIGESIKFVSFADQIKLGDSSRQYVKKLFNINNGLAETEEATQQYNFLMSVGLTPSDLNLLEAEYSKFDEDNNKLLNTKTYRTVGANGTEIVVNGREAVLNNAIQMISDNDDINDKSSEAVLLELKSELKKYKKNKSKTGSKSPENLDPRFARKWEKISKKISMLLQRKRIMKTFKDNPRDAVGIVGLLTLTSGGSADGCILSVADTAAGSLYTTEQTSTLNNVIKAIKNPETAQISATSSGFVMNGIDVDFDGNTATSYVSKKRVLDTIKEEGIGSIQKVMGSELDLSSIQLMIKNQMKLLESFWRIIAKGDLS